MLCSLPGMKLTRLACCFGRDQSHKKISSGKPPPGNDVELNNKVLSQQTDYNHEARKIFSIIKDDPDSGFNHRDLDVIWLVPSSFPL